MEYEARRVRIIACNRKSGIYRDAVLDKMHKHVPVVGEDSRGRVKVRIGEFEIWLERNEFVG